MIERYWLLPSLLSAGAALSLAGFAFARAPFARSYLGAVLLSTSVVHGSYTVMLGAAGLTVPALRVTFAASILQAAFLVFFGKSLLGQLERPQRRVSLSRASGLFALAALLVVGLLVPQGLHRLGSVGAEPGTTGDLACGGLLLGFLLGITGLERLVRRVRDPQWYQLKFLLLGLGVLPVIGVYITSSFLLQAHWEPQFALAHSSVTLLGLGLSAVGLFRLRRPTHWSALASAAGIKVPFGLAISAFVLAMGVAGTLQPRGATMSEYALGVTIASATGVALAVLLASRYVRALLDRFVARTFRKAKYDYRHKWLEVIQAFQGVTLVDAILDRLVDLLGRSFSAGRISVWMQSDADRRYHQVRSVNIEAAPEPLPPSHPLIVRASASPQAIRCEDCLPQDDDFGRATQMRVVGPIWAGELLGLVVLGESLGDSAYDQDDIDLLHAVCHHAGVLVAHAKLAARHRVDAEVRALHELSMFFIHDLKNLAGRLSLVAQNARRFGDEPEFQRSALRTVATTVERMTSLIQKLSTRTPSVRAMAAVRADLFEALAAATETLKGGVELRLPEKPDPCPSVQMPMDALVNVLLNIITNAEQALGDDGEIGITVDRKDDQWLVTIRDNGPGIEPRALADLFQPLGSTKPAGLGVGLYHCRQTLEAAGGSIVVESQLGKGTAVKLCLRALAASREAT
jgi:putative PEP-CTERM system histidine kinase